MGDLNFGIRKSPFINILEKAGTNIKPIIFLKDMIGILSSFNAIVIEFEFGLRRNIFYLNLFPIKKYIGIESNRILGEIANKESLDLSNLWR